LGRFEGSYLTWKPNVTVAAIIEKNGRFLFVEEISGDEVVINQPAGHVERGESLAQAVVRETLEETGYHFVAEALVGIYYWHAPRIGKTYLRFAFAGQLTGHEPDRPLDDGILHTTWLTRDALAAEVARHRSPIVIRCIDDYLAGKRYPLDLITSLPFITIS
jgi:8-oxo-dGTP pyrophosphatase MutT (NUDIX family)